MKSAIVVSDIDLNIILFPYWTSHLPKAPSDLLVSGKLDQAPSSLETERQNIRAERGTRKEE